MDIKKRGLFLLVGIMVLVLISLSGCEKMIVGSSEGCGSYSEGYECKRNSCSYYFNCEPSGGTCADGSNCCQRSFEHECFCTTPGTCPTERGQEEFIPSEGMEIFSYECNLGLPSIDVPCEGDWTCGEWSSCLDDEGYFDPNMTRFRECFTDCPVTGGEDRPDTEGSCSQEDNCTDVDNDGYGLGVNEDCEVEYPDCDDEDAEVYPGAEEVCDGEDNNCDGSADEGCPCLGDDVQECGKDVGVCTKGTQMCINGRWGICTGGIDPTKEICDDGLDNDCDDSIDEGCDCTPGEQQECGTDVGVCESGIQYCIEGGMWGVCDGEVTGFDELCDDELDNNCDGFVDGDDDNCPGAGGPSGTDTCDDGSWNQDEDGIDCGGSCKAATRETVCDDLLDNDNDCKIDCSDIDCFSESACVGGGRTREESKNDADGDGIIDSLDDEPYCNHNGVWESYEDKTCDDYGGSKEEGGSFIWVIIIIIILLLLGGGGYYYFILRKGKGKPGGDRKISFDGKGFPGKGKKLRPVFRVPEVKSVFGKKTGMDLKIKKSMEEAQNILKKK